MLSLEAIVPLKKTKKKTKNKMGTDGHGYALPMRREPCVARRPPRGRALLLRTNTDPVADSVPIMLLSTLTLICDTGPPWRAQHLGADDDAI